VRFPAASGLAATLALVVAGAAQARTIPLHWKETLSPLYGYPAMTFTVDSITVAGSAWSVKASVTNRSKGSIRVSLKGTPYGGPYAQYTFGIFIPSPCTKAGQIMCSDRTYATKWIPRVPSVLSPGQTWRGTFSGTRALPHGLLLSVMFGYFYASTPKKDFSYVTQHEFKL